MKIPKSKLEGADEHAFALAVATYARDLKEWNEHQARLKQHAPRLDAFMAERERQPTHEEWVEHGFVQPYPQPVSHELVMACVRADATPDYEIVDDGPTLEQRLLARKRELMGVVVEKRSNAINSVLPSGKHDLHNLKYSDARGKIILKEDGNLDDQRSDDEKAFCADHEARYKRIAAIHRKAAEATAAIEDMSEEEMDRWSPPEL